MSGSDETEAFCAARRASWEQRTNHGLFHECQFIDGLGQWWNPPPRTRRPSRRYLLEKYLVTLDKRTGFTATEKQVLKARVMVSLEQER